MKVKVEKFTIRHDGNKYILGSIFDMDKKEAEKLIEKGYISIVEEDNEERVEEVIKTEEKIETTGEEVINPEEKVEITEEEVISSKEKTEITEEEIENSEVPKKKKTNKNK
ncbi:hypothetical protein [Fusobacterium varium]|uniref:hypothetical protein n=1 Tax=Fusobacterium varium TaxID=856 RepID=UPI00266B8E85|nr:hypothetical protein [Fusobacterium varium]